MFCKICKEDKPVDDMAVTMTSPVKKYYKKICKPCFNNKSKIVNNLRKDHPYPAEDHVCPICLEGGKKFYLDHDWSTGKFRGYLCNECNLSLGHFRDDLEIIQRAMDYLKETTSD